MKTLRQVSLGLFLVALSATAFAQNPPKATPVLLPDGRVVLVDKELEKYSSFINDDEDAEELNIYDDSTNKETCKTCYVERNSDSANDNIQVIFDPRRK